MSRPVTRQAIVRVVKVAAAMERERGVATGRAAAIRQAKSLAQTIATLVERLDRGELAGEHGALWPGSDFVADREAVRRLLYAAAVNLDTEQARPQRGTKNALDTAAYLVAKHSDLFDGVQLLSALRGVCAQAGIVVTDRRLQQALTRAVNEIKLRENPPT